jgi:hypothetical protein
MAGLRLRKLPKPFGQIDALVSVRARSVEELGATIAKINPLPDVVRTVMAVVLR